MTTRVSTNFCKRIRQLFTRQRKVNYHPIEEAVREYIEAGNTDIHALAQAMNVLPLDLYFMVSSDDLRVHLVDSLPNPHRHELIRQLRDRVYKSHPVQYATDRYGKLKPYSVDELSGDIAHIRCWMAIHSGWKPVKVFFEDAVTPEGEKSLHVLLRLEGKSEHVHFIGRVIGLTPSQFKLLTVEYG